MMRFKRFLAMILITCVCLCILDLAPTVSADDYDITYDETTGFSEFKLRMTFDYIDGTADIKLTISINDILAYDGILTDAQNYFGNQLHLWANGGQTITVRSAKEEPSTYREVTFSDFGISDQTIPSGHQPNGTLSDAENLDGVAFTGYLQMGLQADMLHSFRLGGKDGTVDSQWSGVGLWTEAKTQLAFSYYTGVLSTKGDIVKISIVDYSLTPIDQSLDFGDYPVDFDDGAVIDGVAYEKDSVIHSTGDHKLVYTDLGNEYKRTLALYRLGDLNTDNTVNIVDLLVMKKHMAGNRELSLSGTKAADITLDNEVHSDDFSKLRRNLLEDCDFPDTGYTSNDLENLVDFTVEVESGRDMRVLQLTDPQIIESEQQRTPDRLGGVGSVTYTQWLSTNKDEMYHKYITQVIENYEPDFIIVTGDLIYGEFDDSGEALIEYIEFMDSFKIPWAPIFGNHENESYKGVDWQCQQLENSQYCLFKQRTLTGNGNYTVGLKQDGKYKRVFFMLDSNGCGGMSSQSLENGHSTQSVGFGNDQIEWYTNLAEKMRYADPDIKLSAAFHIQISAFTKAYAKYGFTNSGTINNPINIDTLENAAETDFGYIGRDLKGAWDDDDTVFYSLKNSGFDSIYVGHEHCNSASVVYRGVRFQYGQKSSTYDRANYLQSDGTIVGASTTQGTPIIGGTSIPVKTDGSLGIGELLLYEIPKEPEEPGAITRTEIYDFNGTDFSDSRNYTGVCIDAYSASLISDTSTVPDGYSAGVYGNTNNGASGMASFSATFTDGIDVSKIVSLKVRMYVTSYTPTSGKTPLIRILTGEEMDTLVSESTFESLGGVYDAWCEIDIWPLIKNTAAINDNILERIVMTYRYYTSDTTAKCYYDSIILGYSE